MAFFYPGWDDSILDNVYRNELSSVYSCRDNSTIDDELWNAEYDEPLPVRFDPDDLHDFMNREPEYYPFGNQLFAHHELSTAVPPIPKIFEEGAPKLRDITNTVGNSTNQQTQQQPQQEHGGGATANNNNVVPNPTIIQNNTITVGIQSHNRVNDEQVPPPVSVVSTVGRITRRTQRTVTTFRRIAPSNPPGIQPYSLVALALAFRGRVCRGRPIGMRIRRLN